MEKVIGIDLGTGNSCVATIEGNQPTVITNAEGNRTTPSIVNINGNDRTVGGSAKRKAITEPKNTVSFVKRYMGSNWDDSDVQKMNGMVTYNVINDGNKPRIEIDSKKYSAEEISSFIVAAMKQTAENYLGCDVKKAVITCPAWFNDNQRQATKLAGELAGLEVLRIINEPTAAILASKIDAKGGDKLVLVADIGCGTTDYSLAELSDVDGQLMVEIKASNGDVFLGGQNYDNAIVEWICSEYESEHKVNLRKDPLAYTRIVEAAEKAKCELSSSSTTEINLPYIGAIDGIPQHIVKNLTRAKFESLTASLTEKVVNCARECIKKANVNVSDISEILLVGGSTRMLAIQEALTKAFNKPLNKNVNPDEAVAIGAAIQANILAGGDTKNDLLLLDVTPLSLGIETMGQVMTKLIDANTTIPTSRKQIFSTAVDNQPSVEIHILQGERPMAYDNKSIGRFSLDGIAPAPKGVPQIEVEFSIDANGILSVKATDLGTKKEQTITINNQNSLSKEEIEKIKADAEVHKEADAKKQEDINKLNNMESFVYSVEKTLTDEAFKDAYTDEEKTSIKEKVDKCLEVINKHDVNELEPLVNDLHTTYDPIIKKFYEKSNPNGANGSNPFNFNFANGTNPFANGAQQ